MIWFYTRESKTLRAETRFDNDTAEYVLILHWPDGRTEIERFPDTASFQSRLDALQKYLKDEQWQQKGPPELLADGWPTPPGEPGPVH